MLQSPKNLLPSLSTFCCLKSMMMREGKCGFELLCGEGRGGGGGCEQPGFAALLHVRACAVIVCTTTAHKKSWHSGVRLLQNKTSKILKYQVESSHLVTSFLLFLPRPQADPKVAPGPVTPRAPFVKQPEKATFAKETPHFSSVLYYTTHPS